MKEQDTPAPISATPESALVSGKAAAPAAFNLHTFVPDKGTLKSFAVTYSVTGDGVVIASTDVTRFFNSAGQLEYEISQIHTVQPPAPVVAPSAAAAPAGPLHRLKQWWKQQLA